MEEEREESLKDDVGGFVVSRGDGGRVWKKNFHLHAKIHNIWGTHEGFSEAHLKYMCWVTVIGGVSVACRNSVMLLASKDPKVLILTYTPHHKKKKKGSPSLPTYGLSGKGHWYFK